MKKSGKMVSVIMATYNRENYLPFAIESVLSQTYSNLELHIIDDGSTDGTRALVNDYQDSRIRYYYQENKGQSGAINVGINNAQGDYICFIDSDNIWKLDKLERQIKIMSENPDYHIAYGENEIIDENGTVQSAQNPVQRYSGNIMEKLLVFNFINFNTTMIRIECFRELGGMGADIPAGPDYDLFLKFSTRYRFLYIPEIFAQYRVMKNQMSSNKDRRFQTNFYILNNFIEKNGHLIDKVTIDNTWCRYYTSRGRYLASKKRFKSAISDYFKAIGHMPHSMHPWRALLKLILTRK
jgi:glycosyltransferase involved in cell wall biosynthesis